MNNRLYLLDFMRFIAFPLVILQHVSAGILLQFHKVPSDWWWIGNFYDSVSRICVPLFFIITGAVIFERNLDTRSEIRSFLIKRLTKIVIPLIAWSFIYVYFFSIRNHLNFDIIALIKNILSGNVPYAYQLWYLYAIIVLYLIVPVLKVYLMGASTANVNYFLIVWFITWSLLPLFNKFHIQINVEIFQGYLGYLGYLLIGYKLRAFIIAKNVSKKYFYTSLLAFILGIAITMWGTYMMTVRNNNTLDEFFYNYSAFNVIMMTLAVCVICAYLVDNFGLIKTPLLSKSITFFSSKLSFGIYLVHLLVMAILDSGLLGFRINASVFHPFVSIPITTLSVLICSSVVIYLIRKVPGGKFIAP